MGLVTLTAVALMSGSAGIRAAEPAPAEPSVAPAIPQWFLEHMDSLIGQWRTDNSAYLSEQETAEAYGLRWKWGVGKTSLDGVLYGMQAGEPEIPYWNFRVYWHPGERRARVDQWGHGGTLLSGWLEPAGGTRGETVFESEQTLYAVDGQTVRTRHRTTIKGTLKLTQSFDWEDGNWTPRRSYTWHRDPQE
jgi:hypothetical protein